jgi:Co/Zn/Cd efflux system component
MYQSLFEIPGMDCYAEEKLIRMKLAELQGVHQLEFDLPGRKLTVFHTEPAETILHAIYGLKMKGHFIGTSITGASISNSENDQRKLLWTVLLINFSFFVIEITFGWISNSMGLVADSLDMLADALVYGISLWAVGHALARKKLAASLAGYFQIILALTGFLEILRRFLGYAEMPDPAMMIGVSFFALLANGICLYLIQKSESREEIHIKASMIFTSNDILINLGVMLAGVMVMVSDSPLPDLLVGMAVFGIVVRAAIRILSLGN